MQSTEKTTASICLVDARPSAVTGQPRTHSASSPTASRPAAMRCDSVRIPDAGRACFGSARSLSPERAAHIRQRVLSGAYHSAEMAGAVARRMLERGDL